jgi:hypothetical protein
MNVKKFIKKIIVESLNEERKLFDKLYHGTDINSALRIKDKGINISKGEGYFGTGFYTTPDINLAKSNYADFKGNGKGAVLEFKLKENSNILDLGDSDDFELWKKYARRIYDKSLYKELVRNGIDGLWDNSMDGVVIYNPKVLQLIEIHNI